MVKCEICGKELKDTQGLSGHMRLEHPDVKEAAPSAKEIVSVKPQSIENLIRGLNLPQVTDGTKEIFDAGVEYGMKSILIGVRVAQELSKMGIEQATPIIKMAQEMRQAEGQAAQVAAQEAARETAAQVAAYFDQKKPDIASTPSPMEGVFARVLEGTLSSLMGKLFPGGGTETPPGFTVEKKQKGV
jgi:hypothetical protein